MLGRTVSLGKIIHGDDHAMLKVKTPALAGEVRKRLGNISALLASPEPPDLVLNRHCAECEFQTRCRKIAVEKDDLSLLAAMSAKERQKLRSKGIFTITQLSYTFRPHHRPKRQRDKREKYHHSLKALAIREQKIHIVGSPELKIEGTPVYLDVEGVPDRDFYYLIGVRIGHGDSAIQHSLWADTVADEGKIWREFLALLETVEQPVLIYYGSFEVTFLDQMKKRYPAQGENGTVLDRATSGAVNLLAFVYGQLYFPAHSNGLKDVAGLLGFLWPDPEGTGLNSIVWRRRWEESESPELQRKLFAYNSADCAACELLSTIFSQLPSPEKPENRTEAERFTFVVDHLTNPFSHPDWQTFVGALPELDPINQAAQWDYQRDRIYLRKKKQTKQEPRNAQIKKNPFCQADKVVAFPVNKVCPKCRRKSKHKRGKEACLLQDFLFGKSSVKRRTVKHEFQKFWCPNCKRTFGVDERFHSRQKFGWNLIALNYYMTMELGIPQQVVAKIFERLFNVSMPSGSGASLRTRVAAYYEETKRKLLERITSGSLVHADETKARKMGAAGYVWVFTNFNEVVYLNSESREAEVLLRVLKGFKGVLVSDFYAAYDSMDCPQQKCLIHLMRDLNNDVLANPYDEEFKQFVLDFASLLKPMIDTIDRHGLKRHFLNKHLKAVDQFYKNLGHKEFTSEPALSYKQRFEKNRDKLFTFLKHDGVPWNNNNAEHAIKAYTRRFRAISCGASTPKAMSENLILLSVCQTCKYMGVDFLDFLRSGEKDIHAFAESRRRGRHRLPTSAPEAAPVDAGK